MPDNRIKTTRDKLARMYGVGIVVFAGFFGFITALVAFLALLRLD